MQLRLLFIGLVLFFANGVFAQQTLSGKVSNNLNEPIIGASIKLSGSNRGTTTNVEGRFTLTLATDKKYEIEVSAIGYKTKLISDVEVSTNGDELIVILEDNVKANDEVVVRSTVSRKQENTTALLTFQKNNTAVSSVIAADFIRRTPDKNTGEVLKRVSGASIQDNKYVIIRGLTDRYNSAYINGAQLPSSEPDKKAFSFDVIPSQLIDNIVINKTATPDLTGEFAGGVVQIATKDIPTRNEINIGASLGYNTIGSFKDFTSNPRGSNEWLGFSNRKLPSEYPNSALAYNKLSQDEKAAVAKNFNDDVYRQVKSNSGPIQQYNLTWSNVKRFENGGTLGSIFGVTYRQSKLVYGEGNAVQKSYPGYFDYQDHQNRYAVNWGAVANIAYTKGKHKIAFKNLFNQLLDDNYYTRTGYNSDNLQNVKLYSSVLNQRSLYTTQLEGSHGLFNDIKFNWNLNYSYNSKEQPDLRVQTYTSPDGVLPYQLNNRGNNTNRFFSNLKDNAFGYSAALQIPFTLFDNKQTFKIGGTGLVRLRDFKAVILGYDDPANQSLLQLPYDQIFNKNNFGGTGFLLSTTLQNPSDKYYGISALSAGYLMLDNKLSDKVRLVWGARVENFEQFLKSNDVRKGDTALVINTDKFDVLPSFNLTYSPNIKTNIRLSGSKTVARPEFREIAPFQFFDFEQLSSIGGNVDLKRSGILNGDVRFERYANPGELFSLGAFYKDFTDPIEVKLSPESAPSRRVYRFENAKSAKLFGAELELRKNLTFLSDNANWLSKLYFNGNATVISSKVTLRNIAAGGAEIATTDRPLQGQSPYLINAGFQYEGDVLGVSLLYNRIGQRLALVGNETVPDIYERARDLVDFQISKKVLKKNGELKFTVSDILSQKAIWYLNQDSKKTYNSGSDEIFTSFKPGTTFSLGFNYNFKL